MSRGRKRQILITKDEESWNQQGWTSVPNELIRNSALSIGARWAFSWIASHNVGWYMTAADVADAGGIGINKAEAFVAELEHAGYLTRHYTRNGRGHITGVEYKLFPTPLPEEQRTQGKRSRKDPDQHQLPIEPDPPA